MDAQLLTSSSGLPPIVLLVEDDADTRDLYETAFGFAGLWVAKAAGADDALEYALDLKPDSVVMDVAIPAVPDGLGLAKALRENPRSVETPIVAITDVDRVRLGTDAQLFTAVFYKPVRLDQMVRQVRWLSQKAALLRERSEQARSRVPSLIAKSTELINKSAAIGERRQRILSALTEDSGDPSITASTVRTCPRCHKTLMFSERRTLDGTTFDYYSPCRNGCGLFCYDHSRRKMITLVG